MIRTGLVSALLFSITISSALAQSCLCGGTPLTTEQIVTILNNNTVCAVAGSDRWQEQHIGGSGGSVVELGNTPGGEPVGTWTATSGSVTTGGSVTYAYGDGGPGNVFTFEVCLADGASTTAPTTVNFCGASRNVTAAGVKVGKGGCGP